MTKIFLMLAVGAAAPGAAFAQSLPQTCARGTDERVIEVLSPGEIGAACDLRYTRDGGANISVPYHANSDPAWCTQKAVELIENLQASGFSCDGVSAAVEAAAPSETKLVLEQDATAEAAPVADNVVTATPPIAVAAVEPPAPEPSASSAPQARVDLPAEIIVEDAAVAAAPDEAEPLAAPPAVVAEKAPEPQMEAQQAPDVERAPPVAERALIVAAESAPVAAAPVSNDPVNLTAEAKPAAVKIAPPPTGAGRLIGAAPQEPEPQRLAMPAPQEAVAPIYAASKRPAVDIVKGVLAAQAAAWNEGDLAAFMAGYWNSPDLRFVSDGFIAKGWRDVMKRYQSLYATPADMGRLSFDNLDVKSITDDVTVVTGRYNVAAPTGVSSGTFSLVVKQFDGRWRIVHDHSVSDAAPAE